MSRARKRARLYPPLVVVGTAALLSIAAATLSAAPPPQAAAAAACSLPADAAIRGALGAASARAARVRVSERIGTRGEFVGRQLVLSAISGKDIGVPLSAESSISQDVSNILVYTNASGGRSEVRAIDLSTGCDYLLVQAAGIARSAILDRSGKYLYVHSVSAAGRADAGVSRYAVAGGAGTIVVPPLPADGRYGRTFGTRMSWSVDDATLAVQSCGYEACRTRLLDVDTGVVVTVDDVRHGELIGVTAAHVVANAACHWTPCPVLAISRETGVAQLLADEADSAELTSAPGQATRVLINTPAGSYEVEP